MTHMIPSQIPGIAKRGEQDIFGLLAKDTTATIQSWVVFHSIRVTNPEHQSKQYKRELDFVIIMPDSLSVLCLEVKDRRFDIENEQWYYHEDKKRHSPINTPPPVQAESGMHAFRMEFRRYLSDSLISVGHGVILTQQPRPKKALSYGGLFLFQEDINDLGTNLQQFAHQHLMRRKVFDCEESRLKAQEHLENIKSHLMNDMTPKSPRDIVRKDLDYLQSHLLRLTEEQYQRLQIIENNPMFGCVIDGAAGTGKTVLAMELAKQRCEAGKTVGLLCSNPNLSRRFEVWADTLAGHVRAGRVIAGTPATLPIFAFGADNLLLGRHRRRLDNYPALEKSLKLGYLEEHWNSFIHETIHDLDNIGGGVFDFLVVDEAQNLCERMFLDLMQVLLKGGLKNGNWAMFGDITNQNIVTHGRVSARDVLNDYGLKYVYDKLIVNCRSTDQIAQAITMLTDVQSNPVYGVHGPDVQFEYFSTREHMENLLDDLVSDLSKNKFATHQIMLLSTEKDAFWHRERLGGWKLFNLRDKPGEMMKESDPLMPYSAPLRYSDIYDFQGLESDIAVLILPQMEEQVELAGGISLPREEHLTKLLYTGMSRAKAMLIIVADNKYKELLTERIKSYHDLHGNIVS